MKINHFIFLLFVALFSQKTWATVDDGESAKLLGLIGKNQEYALIDITSIQCDNDQDLSCPGQMLLIWLSGNQTIALERMNYDLSAQEEVTTLDQATEKKYRYFVDHATVNVKNKITSAPFISLVSGKIKKSENTQLSVTAKELKRFDAMRFQDEVNDTFCGEVYTKAEGAPYCDLCSWQTVVVDDISNDYLQCKGGVGKTTKTVTNVMNKTISAGRPCSCHDMGYVYTIELKLGNTTTQGLGVLALPYPRAHYDNPSANFPGPAFDSASVYINSQGQFIATGSLSYGAELNGMYYPVVAMHPGSSTQTK